MKLRLFALVLGLAAICKVSPGQIGVYATPSFTSIHTSKSDEGAFSFLGANQTSRVFSGVTFGVFDQMFHTPALDVGGDLRVSAQRGNSAALNQFLIGPRVSFHPFKLPVKPYVELLGGLGGTRTSTSGVYVSRATFSGSAGVDYGLTKFVDFRVIEVGYQSLQTINTDIVGSVASTQGSSRLLNFSTGIVFVIP